MASPNTRRNLDARADDLYNTPEIALRLAEKAGIFDTYNKYYDPCDGLGVISEYLSNLGSYCYKSDLYNRMRYNTEEDPMTSWDNSWLGEFNFLSVKQEELPDDIQCLVFNPPFTLTEQFIDKAHELQLPLIMFNRLTTLESIGRATKFKDKWNLKELYIFGPRVSCTKGVEMEETANSVAYAWFIFNPNAKKDGFVKVDWL